MSINIKHTLLVSIRLFFGVWLFLVFEHAVGQDIYRTGSSSPVETEHMSGVLLAGGATDNNDAMRWMLSRANGGDVVVLRASGSDGYNNYLYSSLGVDINSVTSIVIRSAAEAENEEVLRILRNAEVVFIAGGNQWNYVNFWRGTALLELLNDLILEKKIAIGGTSAGMAVLGEVVFSAENNTIWSSEALENPYHWRMMLENDFLVVPYMDQTVTDTHYNRQESDGMIRKGRHVGFMSRMVSDWNMHARGIAANEYTAIGVDEEGIARVFGHPAYDDYAYFLQVFGGPPETCEDGEPLHWIRNSEALRVYRIKGDRQGSAWFDLNDWMNGEGGNWEYWYVDKGELSFKSIESPAPWVRISVRDEDTGEHLVGALVQIEGNGEAILPTYGSASFSVNTPEHMTVRVTAEGYFPLEKIFSAPDENIHIQLTLRKDDTSVISAGPEVSILKIYPNPTRDHLVINTPACESVKLRILNVSGIVLDYKTTGMPEGGKYMWPLKNLVPGQYLLEASGSFGRLVKSFVIIP